MIAPTDGSPARKSFQNYWVNSIYLHKMFDFAAVDPLGAPHFGTIHPDYGDIAAIQTRRRPIWDV